MIVFTYQIDEFLNNAQVISLYRANALLQHVPEIPLDDSVATTHEDEAILTNYLKLGSSLIASAMAGYTTDLLDTDLITPLEALKYITEDLTADPVVNAQIIFRINVPTTFNNANITLIDHSIKDALENYVLYRLNKHKGHDWESFKEDYDTAMSQVLLYLNQRTKTVTRSFRMI